MSPPREWFMASMRRAPATGATPTADRSRVSSFCDWPDVASAMPEATATESAEAASSTELSSEAFGSDGGRSRSTSEASSARGARGARRGVGLGAVVRTAARGAGTTLARARGQP